MAEIRIEKKKPVWPWVLVLLLIIGAIAAYFLWDDNEVEAEEEVATYGEEYEETNGMNEDNTTMYSDTAASNNNNTSGSATPLKDYRQHVSMEDGRMGMDHNYTHVTFNKLMAALKYTAEQKNHDIKLDLSKIKTWSDEIQNDPSSLKHADKIKKGMGEVLTAFQNLQKAKYPELEGELDDLKDLHNDMQPNTPTLEQKENVKKFFAEAEEILGKMNRANNQ